MATDPKPSCKKTMGDRWFDPEMCLISNGAKEFIIGCTKQIRTAYKSYEMMTKVPKNTRNSA
jgi:hypothetical protein